MRTIDHKDIQALFGDQGVKGTMVSVTHLQEIRTEFEEMNGKGVFGKVFYERSVKPFLVDTTAQVKGGKSIVIFATKQPIVRIIFETDLGRIPVLLPPIFSVKDDPSIEVEKKLRELLDQHGYHLFKIRIPLKLIAVRSGLAKYGRNTIAYIPGVGSFFKITAFLTDLPATQDSWGEPSRMDSCTTCQSCQKHCPTQAISGEGTLLRFERCLTYYNEHPGDFPEWIDPKWHNCLMGCLVCQKTCPQNSSMLSWIDEQAVFTAEETAQLLCWTSDKPASELSQSMTEKLKMLDLFVSLDFLPRNLSVLLKQHN